MGVKYQPRDFSTEQEAWQILVVRIGFNDLQTRGGAIKGVPREIPLLETHRDVIGPTHTMRRYAILNER